MWLYHKVPDKRFIDFFRNPLNDLDLLIVLSDIVITILSQLALGSNSVILARVSRWA